MKGDWVEKDTRISIDIYPDFFSTKIYNYLELCQVDKFLSNFAQRNHENGHLHS